MVGTKLEVGETKVMARAEVGEQVQVVPRVPILGWSTTGHVTMVALPPRPGWLLNVIELIGALHINLAGNIVYQYKVVKDVEELINFHQVYNGWTYWPMDLTLMILYMTKRRAEVLEQLRAYEGVSAPYSFSLMFLVHMDINQEICSGGGGQKVLQQDTSLDGVPYASEAVIWLSGDLFEPPTRQLLLPGRVDAGTGSVFKVLKEIQTQGVEGIRTMAWIYDSIIVGTVNGYKFFSSSTGRSASMFSLPDPSSRPYLKSLWKNYEVLLLVDNVGIVVNDVGQPVGGSLVFQNALESIGEISNYLIVVSDGKMELFHKKTGVRVQLVSFARKGLGSCIVANEETGNGEYVVVATSSKVWVFVCY
ncbi:hypothetical protein GIB67_005329 [Kingdonia uniflora]|uniref:CNH domain-containing protein n=1 Tax=Kingdonia uniflora TaxID=39325 RepID=A0A7J7ND77_9MAGN|nr:hypothetical protein GIB67_005329 [Kingdonia uniflora]